MARYVAQGVESVENAEAVIRTVPEVSPVSEASEPAIPEEGDVYVSHDDLKGCDGLIIGSPTRFGNMAAPMKYFLDTTGPLWMEGTMTDKPAACFTSTGSMHGGQETTLLTMMMPLFHHGCILVGLPSNEPGLSDTNSGGTPYGPSHRAGGQGEYDVNEEEAGFCISIGKRVATLARGSAST